MSDVAAQIAAATAKGDVAALATLAIQLANENARLCALIERLEAEAERRREKETTRKRARRALAPDVTLWQRRDVLERDAYRCRRCGAITALHIDHVVPVAAGGLTEIDNLQTLCALCNWKKGARING
jgi:5-methylcytosine-specific restriction endonuclease McrA